MTREQIFNTSSMFQFVRHDAAADSWYFAFTDKIAFNVSAIWRLIKNKRIKCVSLDYGHQLGPGKPINLVKVLTEVLAGKQLVEIKIKQGTPDLILTFTDELLIEIFIN